MIYARTGITCLLMGSVMSLLAQSRQTDSASLHSPHMDSASLKEIRIIGQKPLTERKLDRTIVHVDAQLTDAGGHALDILEKSPGVTVDDDGTISLNGKSGVLVLIDDRPTYLSGQDLVSYLKNLPASQLEQIELLPTPPARYPASGDAGIIIIRTKKTGNKGFRADITTSYNQGVYARTDNTINLSERTDRFQFTGMAGFSSTNNYYQSDRSRRYYNPDGSLAQLIIQNHLEISHQTDFTYNGGIEFLPEKAGRRSTTWGFLFSGYENPYHETGHYTDEFYTGSAQADSQTHILSHFHNHPENQNANAHFLRTMSHPGRSFSADADFVHYQTTGYQVETSSTQLPDSSTTGGSGVPGLGVPSAGGVFDLIDQQPFTADIYSLKADYTDRFNKNIFLEAGLQPTWSRRQNSGSYLEGSPGSETPNDSLNNTFTYREQINAAYVALRSEQKRFSLQAGLRLENTLARGQLTAIRDSTFRISYTNLFPSFHASWNMDSNGRGLLFFSYARRIDRPSYNDLNPARFYFDQYTYFSGNPTLFPEFSDNFEMSYTWLDRYTLTAQYSRTKGGIMLAYLLEGNSFFYYTINLDLQTTAGISADISTPLTSNWSINTHAEWMYKHYFGMVPGPFLLDKTAPYFLLSGSTKYSFRHGWSGEISGMYKDDVLFGESVLRPVGRLNIAIRKKLWKDKGSVTLGGNDILRTWIVGRNIYLPNALVHFQNSYDRREAFLSFSYSFGRAPRNIKRHTTGVEDEKSRL